MVALIAHGEGWHNNHHAFPNSASFALRWFSIDLGYWFIRLLALFGLAWDVRVPGRDQITARAAKLEARHAGGQEAG